MTQLPEDRSSSARRQFLGGAIAGMAASALASQNVEAAEPSGAKRTGLYPDGVPSADVGYSPGIAAEGKRVVFVSGQGSDDVKADMETQMRQTFDKIGKVLAEAGATWENVVMMRSFFVHLNRDLPAYRKVRKEYLKKPYPASTAVGTTELAIPGLDIEIEAIAIV
ncbi:MAG: Rid family hydrolase [Planctomycetaceae bacterium]